MARDVVGRLFICALSNFAGFVIGQNCAGGSFVQEAYGAVAQALTDNILERSVVGRLSSEKVIMKNAARKFINDISCGGCSIQDSYARYDVYTVADVETMQSDLFAQNIASNLTQGLVATVLSLCPFTTYAGVAIMAGDIIDNTVGKVQICDPTQRKYELAYTYTDSSTGWPRYKSTLKFTMGEYTDPNGDHGYSVVQTSYEKAAQYNGSDEWIYLPRETLKTHAGEK